MTQISRVRGLVWRCALAAAMAAMVWQSPAQAHPHVFVTSKATVVYDQGRIVGIEHVWTFDEFYTAMAIQGLDTNNDGVYSREELAELAKVNMDGLKEFDYFTDGRVGESKLKFGAPTDPWLDHKDGILSLHFRLPLEKPLESADGFKFAIYDPSYFIAFEFAKGDAVVLGAGAPAGCKAILGEQQPDTDAKTLTGAFAEQGLAMGASPVKSVAVTCVKS
jgi:ABC-type uncharacterized transport system substrate-binding protein